jgi:stalled ribosome rescue protein Dom34
MISAALWISSEEAKIFKFKPDGVEIHHMKSDFLKHKAEVEGKNHLKREGDAEKFFHQVALYVSKDNVARWVVVGAGVAKTQLKHHIDKHHPQLVSKILGVEAIDKSTDGEIQNFAHDFFKKHPVPLA